jgi:NADH-quinone oxidoreductase subunit G
MVAARLATWHQLLDAGRMQDGEPYLAGTARPVVAKLSAATAGAAGVSDGEKVVVAAAAGSITVPVDVVPMADGVVWLPANSPGSAVRTDLGAGHGSRVTLRRAE